MVVVFESPIAEVGVLSLCSCCRCSQAVVSPKSHCVRPVELNLVSSAKTDKIRIRQSRLVYVRPDPPYAILAAEVRV